MLNTPPPPTTKKEWKRVIDDRDNMQAQIEMFKEETLHDHVQSLIMYAQTNKPMDELQQFMMQQSKVGPQDLVPPPLLSLERFSENTDEAILGAQPAMTTTPTDVGIDLINVELAKLVTHNAHSPGGNTTTGCYI